MPGAGRPVGFICARCQRTSSICTGVGLADGWLGCLSTPPQIVSPLANCNLEMVDDRAFGTGTLALQSGHANVFKGWLDAAGVANPVYWMRFDDTNAERHMQTSFSLTEQRADVAAARPDAPLVSGFRLTLPHGVLPVGSYHVYLAVESGGKTYVCDSGRYIDANH